MLIQAIQHFAQRWRREYLTSLTSRYQQMKLNGKFHQFRVGDLVLLQLPHLARDAWPMARILEIYPDDRGVVRSVKVCCNHEDYLRPINQLVPLQLDIKRVPEESTDIMSADNEEETPPSPPHC